MSSFPDLIQMIKALYDILSYSLHCSYRLKCFSKSPTADLLSVLKFWQYSVARLSQMWFYSNPSSVIAAGLTTVFNEQHRLGGLSLKGSTCAQGTGVIITSTWHSVPLALCWTLRVQWVEPEKYPTTSAHPTSGYVTTFLVPWPEPSSDNRCLVESS